MTTHDWTRVEPGILYHFHLEWIAAISNKLNSGILPVGFYALAEEITGGFGPDVVTLQAPSNGSPKNGNLSNSSAEGKVALLSAPPKTWYRATAEIDSYAAKANAIAIRHASDHRVVAVIEIVSPGNKNRPHALRQFVEKAAELIWAGVHLLVIDLFPPSTRDPEGIHKAIWERVNDVPFALPGDKRLTLAAYVGAPIPEAYVEPVAVGSTLPDMALFLNPRQYVLVPLEATYQSAWNAVPEYWRNFLTNPSSS